MSVASRVAEILQYPVFLSTVTPGKLPTFCFNPVNELKSELFPLLGLPTNAMFISLANSIINTKLTVTAFIRLRIKKEEGVWLLRKPLRITERYITNTIKTL